MARIVDSGELTRFFPRKSQSGVVLTGGCFDILHIGHVRFLSAAKGMGDYLVILLESDWNVKRLKGSNRPVFTQEERAEMLSALGSVDLVVLLPRMENDDAYMDVVTRIKPAIIAIAENDPHLEKKSCQAKEIGGELKIAPLSKKFSTSRLANILGVE
jgi:rfaE bifunctional protein nucleotidyltransferase chain/domain